MAAVEVYESAMDITLEEIYNKAPNIRRIQGKIFESCAWYLFNVYNTDKCAYIFFFLLIKKMLI